MSNLKKAAFLFVILGICSPSMPLRGAVVTYTDRPTFDAAASPTDVEDFNTFVSDVFFDPTPLDVGAFTMSVVGADPLRTPSNNVDVPPFVFTDNNIDGTPTGRITVENQSAGTLLSVFLTFDAPIKSFGADFYSLNNTFNRTRIVAAGEQISPPTTSGDQLRFFGFVSDTEFSIVEFQANSGQLDGFAMDNITFGPIPEPTTLTLAAFALLGLVGRRKRRA